MRIKIPKKGYKKLTKEKARIIAHLIGDGTCCKVKHDYNIQYEVKDKESLVQFHEDLISVYGLIPSWGQNPSGITGQMIKRVRLRSKLAFEDLEKYASYYSKNWEIKQPILDSTIEIKKEFLKALFDDEGSIFKVKYSKILRLYSINLDGLKQIQDMLLKEFNIESKITPGYGLKRNVYGLIVKDLKLFKEKVGFNLTRKQERLLQLI